MSNSAADFHRIFESKIERIKRLLRRLPRDMANEGLLFVMNLFKKEESPEGEKWKPRKSEGGDRSSRRGLLIKSGRLRKSIRTTRKTSSNTIWIGTSVPYAKYHNEGSDKIPKRQFLGRSAALDRRLQRMIKAKILWELRK